MPLPQISYSPTVFNDLGEAANASGGGHSTPVPGERYFYLLHRVGDLNFRKGRKKVDAYKKSGGVGANRMNVARHPVSYRYFFDDWDAFDRHIEQGNTSEILYNIPQTSESRAKPTEIHPWIQRCARSYIEGPNLTDKEKGLMSWFYIDSYHGKPINDMASPDELVYRVPESWLRRNALWCVELIPQTNIKAYPVWAFLTVLVMPNEFHITKPDPPGTVPHLTSTEVGQIVYEAHVKADPDSRKDHMKEWVEGGGAAT